MARFLVTELVVVREDDLGCRAAFLETGATVRSEESLRPLGCAVLLLTTFPLLLVVTLVVALFSEVLIRRGGSLFVVCKVSAKDIDTTAGGGDERSMVALGGGDDIERLIRLLLFGKRSDGILLASAFGTSASAMSSSSAHYNRAVSSVKWSQKCVRIP